MPTENRSSTEDEVGHGKIKVIAREWRSLVDWKAHRHSDLIDCYHVGIFSLNVPNVSMSREMLAIQIFVC